jgi:chemotaxis protein CheD
MSRESYISVGIGNYAVSKSPCILETVLGSCVGVLVYDNVESAGGLAHVYLPDSKVHAGSGNEAATGVRYADILIPLLLRDMEKIGSSRSRIIAYIIGGATLFPGIRLEPGSIGEKNLEAVRTILKQEGIPFRERSVGGTSGRKVTFRLADGDIRITDLLGIAETRIK